MTIEPSPVLAIGAHSDDFVSAAGTMALLAAAGWRVTALTVIGGFASYWGEERADEVRTNACAAAEAVGARHRFLDFPYNVVPHDRAMVEGIARVLADEQPRLVLLPWPDDHHPDHRRVAQAAMEALCYQQRFGEAACTWSEREILAYEISPWQTRGFDPDLFVALDTGILDAIAVCWDRFREWPPATRATYLRSTRHRLGTWGAVIGREAAEGFRHLGPRFPLRSFLPAALGDRLVAAGSPQYPHGWRHFAALTP
jgi:LmbE family N-acetylglucosaminyl deacetylase